MIEAIGDSTALDHALASGGSPDARDLDGRSALEVAIEADDPASLQRLLAAGADANAARPDGWTPLHMAVDYEGDSALQNGVPMDLRFIRPLLDAGGDPTAEWTSAGAGVETPLDMAHFYGHLAAVEAMTRATGRTD